MAAQGLYFATADGWDDPAVRVRSAGALEEALGPLRVANARLCGGNGSPCETMEKSSVLAVVDVTEVTPEPRSEEIISTDSWYIVKFRVVERFKGLSEEEEITGRFFRSGEDPLELWPGRWLLYTYKDKDGNWHTSCSRTKRTNTAEALEEVEQLRRCSKK